MLFNSIQFLIFLPIVVFLYFTLPFRLRRWMLLGASLYFYCVFSWEWCILMVAVSLMNWWAAVLIDDFPAHRKKILWCSLLLDLLVLCVCKYHNFLGGTIEDVTGYRPWAAATWLPMGVSFYTFQAMSYTIDVYRGQYKADRSPFEVLLYITFFTQLVAGPIMRGDKLIPQLREKHEPNADRMLSGALLVVWGLLKKVMIADPIGNVVEQVYGSAAAPLDPSSFHWSALLVATYAFAVQIYCDFSAYSDIAIGSGRILGFRMMVNFDTPYLSTTIREFWRRWHISLSTWLRDYLYIPLGGSRLGTVGTYANLMTTMLLGGLWHGASWNFVIWGGLQGVYLSGERMLGIDRLERRDMTTVEIWLRGIFTFHLVCLAWVFFRAKTSTQAFGIIGGIFTGQAGETIGLAPVLVLLGMIAVQLIKARVHFQTLFLRVPGLSRWMIYGSLAVISMALMGGKTPEFIYFQF